MASTRKPNHFIANMNFISHNSIVQSTEDGYEWPVAAAGLLRRAKIAEWRSAAANDLEKQH